MSLRFKQCDEVRHRGQHQLRELLSLPLAAMLGALLGLRRASLGLVYTVSSLLEQSTPSSLEVQDLDGSVSQLSFSDKAAERL